MAGLTIMKFQPSAIAATSLSGKLGGTVGTINNTFRRKSNPRQPDSDAQMAIRARWGTISTSWGELTEDQQDSWINAAPNFIFFKHGEAYTLKGNTLYQKLNNNLLRAGLSMITTAPAPGTFPFITIESSSGMTWDESINVWVCTLNADPGEGFTIMGLLSPQFSPGKRSVDNLIIEPGPLTVDEDNTINLAQYIEPGDHAYVAGNRCAGGFYLINNNTGQATTWTTIQSVIQNI